MLVKLNKPNCMRVIIKQANKLLVKLSFRQTFITKTMLDHHSVITSL